MQVAFAQSGRASDKHHLLKTCADGHKERLTGRRSKRIQGGLGRLGLARAFTFGASDIVEQALAVRHDRVEQ